MPKRKNLKGKGILSDVHDFVKQNQLISKGLQLAGNPFFAGSIANQLGYGKKKAKKRVMKGRGIFGDLGGGLGSLFGGLGGGIGSIAHGLFGGKKAKTRKRRKVIMI